MYFTAAPRLIGLMVLSTIFISSIFGNIVIRDETIFCSILSINKSMFVLGSSESSKTIMILFVRTDRLYGMVVLCAGYLILSQPIEGFS